MSAPDLPPPLPGVPRVSIAFAVNVEDEAALHQYIERTAQAQGEPLVRAWPGTDWQVQQAYAICLKDAEEAGLGEVYTSAKARPGQPGSYDVQLYADVRDDQVLKLYAWGRDSSRAPGSPEAASTSTFTFGRPLTVADMVAAALVINPAPERDQILRRLDHGCRAEVLALGGVDLARRRYAADEAPDPGAIVERKRIRRADVLWFEPVLVSRRGLRSGTAPYYSWATAAVRPDGSLRTFRWRRDGRLSRMPADFVVPPRRLQLEVPWFEEQYAREHPRALLLVNAARGGSRRLSYRVEFGRYEANERLALRIVDGAGVPSLASLNVPCAYLKGNQAIVNWAAVPVLEAAGAARDTFQRISVGPKTFPIVEVVNPGPPTFRAPSGEKADVAELVASLGITRRGLER